MFSKELSSFWNMIVRKLIQAVDFIFVPFLKVHNQLTLLRYTDFPPFHFFPLSSGSNLKIIKRVVVYSNINTIPL